MKVSAFTYVRNGIHFDYPFLASIQSVLPIVDELVVVVGDSFDGTREAILGLNNPKIKIVDTIWDEQMRIGGHIFAQQANIGLDNVSADADWAFHIQADEVIHEKEYAVITNAMQENLNNKKVEGLLFNFINFFGDYMYYAPSRRYHQNEIRIVRNDKKIRSYKDSQGFRIFNDPTGDLNQEKGEKLRVKKIDASIFHYSYVKNPELQYQKHLEFGKRWQPTDDWIKDMEKIHQGSYQYNHKIDYLKLYKGTHPAVMQERIASQDWEFIYNPSINDMTLKEKLLRFLERVTGKQFFIYKNYKIVR